MSHREATCFIRTCDGCGTDYRDGTYEYVPHWPSLEEMLSETPNPDDEWQEIDAGTYCPACYDWDAETGDLYVKKRASGAAS